MSQLVNPSPVTDTAADETDTATATYPAVRDASPGPRVLGHQLPEREIWLSARGEAAAPVVDVVIPVFNEVHTIAASVSRLHSYLQTMLPASFRITIADNASTDGTWTMVRYLNRDLEHVAGVRLTERGRGHALHRVWGVSQARVLSYMDVELSTDLGAVLPLLAPLLSGHSDLAIGSRLARGARVVRGRKRELISRVYNRVVRASLRAGFSDAQCGFKAITADAAHLLLPHVRDTSHFFDTELLLIAERAGLRIYEVPVDWIENPDSHADLVDTAVTDLRGLWRMRGTLRSGAIPLAEIGARLNGGRIDVAATGAPTGPAQTTIQSI
ncbi:glycosyltransferase [Jatrophihabitans telluris]|uniref:Glycosyltransferase n=1 Tax=Jatrophihabitans telluris TaxID=2038343 RepID=A0ABY4QWD4_9ACTN|nr:glycosyltransferase [Jatrophihabitans telluris]UQX87835.1 glycosyltransferase [Jatrophihabitans telluris]